MAKKVICFIGPSGSGKTTIVRHLCRNKKCGEIISTTTRTRRPSEKPGKDYNFVSKERFELMDKIESTEYTGNYYGITADEVKSKLSRYEYVFAVVDLAGFIHLKTYIERNHGIPVSSVFINVNKTLLIERLVKRGDSSENILKRIKNLDNDIKSKEFCDVIFENNKSIINYDKLKRLIEID